MSLVFFTMSVLGMLAAAFAPSIDRSEVFLFSIVMALWAIYSRLGERSKLET